MRMPRRLISGLCAAAAAPMPLLAATANELPAAQWNIVPEQTLAQMRGGMDIGQLVASFAMDRVVEVNGAVVAQAHLVISNLDQLGKGGMPTISVSGPLAQVVQILGSGAVNVVTPPGSGAATTANAATAGAPVAPNAATSTASNASTSIPNATASSLSNASAPSATTTPSATATATATPSPTSVTPSSAAASTPTPASPTSASAPLVNAPAASSQASPAVGPQVTPTASAGAIVVASATSGSSAPITPGQAVAPGSLPSNAAIGTAVQNSMNSAMIQAQTTISASLNSLGQLNSMTLANAIRQQVYASH